VPLACRFAATVGSAIKGPPSNATLAQETVVMPLNKVCLHLAHGIEHDAHNDQQTCATKKLRRDNWHIQSLAEETWQYRYQREENRTGKRQSRHGEIKKVRRRFSRSHPRDVTSVFLQVICDLRWLELRGDPEITEKENHRRESDVMWPAGGKRVGDTVGDRTVLKP
jgi:hypothetical protein